jgi:enamine deaminase RidA (YjgF/YER057c/UK114 family)
MPDFWATGVYTPSMLSDPEARMAELGLELPPAPEPRGLYRPVVIVDHLVYVSGHGPVLNDGSLMKGRVGTQQSDLSRDQGKAAARQVALTVLASLKRELTNLNRLRRVVKVLGMVNSASDFHDHPYVINGFSEVFAELFGPNNGVAARSAVGMILPENIVVEVEATFELKHV